MKGVTFDALEDIEKNNDSIDKLTSVVSKMNIKIDKCEAQYKPQVYQCRRRGQNRCEYRQDNYQPRNRSYSRDQNMSYRGRGNYNRTIDQIIEVEQQNDRHDTYRQECRTDNYRTNYRPNYGRDKIIGNRDIELEVKVGIILEITTEIIQGKGLNEVEI